LDQKGKTAEYYLKNNPVVSANEVQELSQFALTTNPTSLSTSQTRLNRIGASKKAPKPARLRPLVPKKTPDSSDSPTKRETGSSETEASATATPPSTPQREEAGGSEALNDEAEGEREDGDEATGRDNAPEMRVDEIRDEQSRSMTNVSDTNAPEATMETSATALETLQNNATE